MSRPRYTKRNACAIYSRRGQAGAGGCRDVGDPVMRFNNLGRSIVFSADDSEFLARVDRWLSERGKLLVLFRYSHTAGNTDNFFLESAEAFRAELRKASPKTSVIAFRQRQLPLRGVVDDGLIRVAQWLLPDDAEFLIIDLEPQECGWSSHEAGEGHLELQESLTALSGIRSPGDAIRRGTTTRRTSWGRSSPIGTV
jgi:hypothetical protein